MQDLFFSFYPSLISHLYFSPKVFLHSLVLPFLTLTPNLFQHNNSILLSKISLFLHREEKVGTNNPNVMSFLKIKCTESNREFKFYIKTMLLGKERIYFNSFSVKVVPYFEFLTLKCCFIWQISDLISQGNGKWSKQDSSLSWRKILRMEAQSFDFLQQLSGC